MRQHTPTQILSQLQAAANNGDHAEADRLCAALRPVFASHDALVKALEAVMDEYDKDCEAQGIGNGETNWTCQYCGWENSGQNEYCGRAECVQTQDQNEPDAYQMARAALKLAKEV